MTVSPEIATPLKSPDQKTDIPRNLALQQIDFQILDQSESVPRNLSFSIWWTSGL